MAKRFIDAEMLKDDFCEHCVTHKRYHLTVEQCRAKEQPTRKWCFKMRLIDNTSTADVVEVRHGEWKYIQMDNFRQYKVICPFCEAEYVGNYDAYIEPGDFNYCPNCGARMDGDEDDL